MNYKQLLIIDCGHSRIKFRHYSATVNSVTLDIRPFKWPSEDYIKQYNECLLMGTNERLKIRVCAHIKSLGLTAPIHLGKDIRVPGIKCETEGTGNDRLALALGAQQTYPNTNCLVISAGTALVIDYVENNTLKGGLIGLGFDRYKKSMQEINATLITDQSKSVQYPGIDTSEAVYLGWLEQAIQTILSLQSQLKVEQTIITGGDAEILLERINAQHTPWLASDTMARVLGYLS